MAFNPTYDMPANWIYEWYQGFVSALQTEVNKEYGYDDLNTFKQDWGTFDIDIDGAQVLNSALSAFVGSPLANKVMPVKPMTIDTDDGPRTVIATGVAVTASTGEAVRMQIDGFLTSIPWDTVVAEVMMANNYQIQPNMLTELSCKIASQIVGHVVTDTSGLYVTGKICLDPNGVARSYVDDYVVQGLIDGAAAADLLNKTELDDVEVDEVIDTSEIPIPAGTDVLTLAHDAVAVAINAQSSDFRNTDRSGETVARAMDLIGNVLGRINLSEPGWYFVMAWCIASEGTPRMYLQVTKYTAPTYITAVRAKEIIGSLARIEIQLNNRPTWYRDFDYTSHSTYTAVATPSGVSSANNVAQDFYTGLGVQYLTTFNTAYSSSIISQTVIAPEIDIHDIDTWGPTQEAHAIDELWPGWLDGARIGAGAIDVDSNVWFPTRDVPLGIDQTDVLNPGQTIAKPLDVAQAGALAGAETGAITITDTIADAITIPSIYNPAIAIPATVAPTPTPTPIIPVLPPSVSAQRLYTVHQVRQDQIDALGAYLWSTDFISLIEHMFTEPIDAVIGLHTLFYGGSLPVGSSETIKLGAISATGCTGQPVQNQYMKFQCGSVNIPEYWNNANDYAPYTKCEIFLPFIGFRDLDINEIMGGSVSLSYGIDIFTGACVAMIGVMRDHVSQALYTFEGNCAVQQPVTGADYSRIVGGLISAGMGIATGGVGAVVGTAAALTSHKITYNRSGNISANAGACMPKTPYIIIKRPNAYDAPNYRHYYGDPANWTVTLGQCSGYTRVKDVHIDSVACIDAEKAEIVRLLRQGVIF